MPINDTRGSVVSGLGQRGHRCAGRKPHPRPARLNDRRAGRCRI